ncbi:MAG: CRTAC1 family protein [Myxococcota bacterium]
MSTPAARTVAFAVLLLAACESEPAPPAPAPAPSLFEGEAEPATPATPSAPAAAAAALRFDDVTEAWSVSLRHHAGRHDDRWLPEVMSGSVSVVDVDRNGALDLILIDSGSVLDDAPTDAGHRLLLGDGKGGFTDATKAWGLDHAGYPMGLAAGDIDNDGWVDLYVTSFGEADRLYRNDGGTRFVDVTEAWGIAPKGWSTSAAFFDLENDGDLDLYVARYVDYTLEDAIKCWYRSIHIYCTPAMYEPQPDRVLRNDGGTFVDVSEASGVQAEAAKGLAIATGDLDDDGDTDLYVGDDISQNLMFLSDGKGALVESAIVAGVAYSDLGREEASMGIAIAEADAEPGWDIAVTNFQAEPVSLYSRRSGGIYRERSDAAGIGAPTRARLSFGIDWLDADNDGDEDLIVANGHINDNIATFRESVTFGQANSLFARVADGRFEDVSASAGTALAKAGVSRGLAVGDLDGDGGVDYVVVENDGAVQVAKNATENRGHWVSLWLEGTTANRSAIGAVVTLTAGGRTQRREVRGATSYLSVSDRRLHFGLADATAVDTVEIRWPGGDTQSVKLSGVDAHVRIVQGKDPQPYTPGESVIAP